MTTDEKIDLLLSKFDNLENRLDNLENKFDNFENRFNDLEHQLKLNTATVENAINRAIDALNDGYHLNAERFDKLDIETVKNKADIAFAISRLTSEKIDRLIEKLNLPA